MDAVPVDAVADLALHHRAVAAGLVAGLAVGGAVAADDQGTGLGARVEDLGQGAHEDVEAAHRFEVAGDIGQDLVLAGQGTVETAKATWRPGSGVRVSVRMPSWQT
jgi:hypothetical protein